MKKYTIVSGDTLGSIAKKFYNDSSKYKEIAKANNMDNPNNISIGQEIIIPDLDSSNSTKETGNLSENKETNGMFTFNSLELLMPQAKEANIKKYLNALNSEMQEFKINTSLRVAHFIAQLAHESGSFNFSSENLNYSSSALRKVFGKYFPTDKLAEEYARKPEKIANRVYANRMQNGDEKSGDGWKYRGRGLIQLTGKENYTNCGQSLNLDLVNNPDQLANNANIAVAAAGWFWNVRNLNNYADKDDIKGITKRINGGYNGLDDREKFLNKAKEIFNI